MSMLSRTDIRMAVTDILDEKGDVVTKLVNYVMAELEAEREDAFGDGFSEGEFERQEGVNNESYQQGYSDGHNAFIQQIVDTLDFKGQEAMITHIERAIGFGVNQGNACR